MSQRASIILIVAGSALIVASCVAYGIVAGWPTVRIPVSTPWTATLLFLGAATIAAGAWLPVWLFRRRHATSWPPARRVGYGIPARRPIPSRAQSTALRARLRGGSAAAPRGTNGGGAAAAPTQQLPAVADDEGEQLTITLPPLTAFASGGGHRGRPGGGPPGFPGRPSMDVRTSGGDVRTMVVASDGSAASCSAGAATTEVLHSVCASRMSRVGSLMRARRQAAHRDAALVLVEGRDEGRSTTWTAGSGCVAAGLGGTTNH